jgi:hypothetical protein
VRRILRTFLVSSVLALCALGSAVVPGGAAAACAQDLPIPTLGPIDPACSRVPDTDADKGGYYDYNCLGYNNPTQVDTDSDSGPKPYEPVPITARDPQTGGDACDVDDDSDGITDVADNCPKNANKDQADTDGDAIGDPCDPQTTTPKATTSAVPHLSFGALPRRVLVSELRAGLAVPVRCTTACALTAELRVGSKIVGRGKGQLADGASTFVFVRLGNAALRRLRHGALATVRVRSGAQHLSRRIRISA